MSHSEKCPVCNGTGKIVRWDGWGMGDAASVKARMQHCHGCGGRGWVQVEDEPRIWERCYAPLFPEGYYRSITNA